MGVTVWSLLLVGLACAAQAVRGGEHGLESSSMRRRECRRPSQLPARFSIEVEERPVRQASHSHPSRRRVLDTEKTSFTTGESEQVGYEVKVSVERGGVVGGEGRKEPSRVLFNLDCEELRMGVPLRVWHMAVVAVPALVLLIAFMLATALRRGEEGEGIRAPKMRSRARVREVPP